jgi:hypothetical protein
MIREAVLIAKLSIRRSLTAMVAGSMLKAVVLFCVLFMWYSEYKIPHTREVGDRTRTGFILEAPMTTHGKLSLPLLYEQAVFDVTQYFAHSIPLKPWLCVEIGYARAWLYLQEYTAYTYASVHLQRVMNGVISFHPSQAKYNSLCHVLHPALVLLDINDREAADWQTWEEWYFDVAVGWLEHIGVRRRIALDLTQALLNNLEVGKKFLSCVEDPYTPSTHTGQSQYKKRK